MRLNIRARVALTLVIGVLIPSLIVGGIQLELEHRELLAKTTAAQDSATDRLAVAIQYPVWNIDHVVVQQIVDSFMSDPSVSHVVVEIGAYVKSGDSVFHGVTSPRGRANSPRILTRQLSAGSKAFGQLSVEYEQDYITEELWQRAGQMLLLTASLLLSSLALLMLGARYGLIRPLTRLSHQARMLARGSQPAQDKPWTRQDEIGDLGRTLDWAGSELATLVRATEASAHKFSSVFQTAPEWLTISRARDAVFLEVNKGFEQATGWSSHEAIGRSMVELGIWRELDQVFMARLRKDRQMRGYECELIRKNGTTWQASVSAAMTLINGEAVVIAVAHDITALRQQEEELRASEARLTGLFGAVPDAVTVTRATDGRVIEVNAAFTEITGWSRDEAIGRTMTGLGIWANPADRDRYVREIMEHGQLRNLPAPFHHKNGSLRYASFCGASFNVDGQANLVTTARDITEALQQEASLRDSQARFSGMFKALPDAISISRLSDGTIVEVNDGFQWICGWAREQVVERPIDDLNFWVHPAQHEKFIRDVVNDHVVWDFAAEFRRADGIWREGSIAGAVFDASGISYLVMAVRDVTAVKQQELALKRTHAFMTRAQEVAGMGVWQLHIDSNVTHWSQNLFDTYGIVPPADGSTLPGFAGTLEGSEVSKYIHPEDRQRVDRQYRNWLRTRHKLALQHRIIRPDGAVRLLRVESTEIEEADGRMITAWGLTQDITEQVDAENAMRELATKFTSIFHTAPEWLTISRLDDGRFVEVNRGFEVATGWLAPEAIGRTLAELGIWPSPPEEFLKGLRTREGIHDHECELVRKDGTVWRAAFSAAVADINDEPMVICVVHDITEMREKDVALQAAETARKAAEAANAMKNDFLAMISHEVRTPLGGVIGMIRFGLRDRGLQSATREKLDLGLANAESLLQIINDILDYSKLEAGKMTLEVMDFDLPKLVRDTVAMLAERAESKGLSLVYEIDAGFPQWWHGDPTRLRQVLVNLAGNAIKFTLDGEVRIAVEQAQTGLTVTVRDTGIGIAAEALPRLFQKFEQADASTSRRFGGTGLGLAICRSIVEAMGGTITVESTLGVGTTFRMTLPLPKGKPVVDSESDRAAEHQYRLNILCAEDGMTNQVILRELVTGMGHTFTLTEDGEAALVALSQADYDLLLLDSRMPRLDGLDVLKALRAGERNVRQPELAVIAVTANAGKEERERFMAAGAQGFLPKPIDEHALQVEIGRVIEWLLEREHVLPVIESTTAEPSPQLDAGNTALAAPGAMSASPAMRQAFLTEGPRLLGELRKALDAGDGATAARSAHSLKGMAGYFAAPDLQEQARLAEHAADAGKLDEAREQLAHMQASVARVLAALGGETVKSEALPPANATKALSQDELNTLLATLEQQLARSSLDAETTLATLREGLAAGEAAELAATMAKHLEGFDFGSAHSLLAPLRAAVGLS